jgi:hypothetical protein
MNVYIYIYIHRHVTVDSMHIPASLRVKGLSRACNSGRQQAKAAAARRAYRAFVALEEHAKLGRVLVSFANPAKPGNERGEGGRGRSGSGGQDAGRSGQQQQQQQRRTAVAFNGGGSFLGGPAMGPGPMMGGPGFPLPGRGFPDGPMGPQFNGEVSFVITILCCCSKMQSAPPSSRMHRLRHLLPS